MIEYDDDDEPRKPPRKIERPKEKAHLESPADEAEQMAYEEENKDRLLAAIDNPVALNTAKKTVHQLVTSILPEAIIYLIGEARNPKNPSKFRAEMYKEVLSHGLSKSAPKAPVKPTVKKTALSLAGMPSIPTSNGKLHQTDTASGSNLGDQEPDEENEASEME